MTIINVSDKVSEKFQFLRPPDLPPSEFLSLLLKEYEKVLKKKPEKPMSEDEYFQKIEEAIFRGTTRAFDKLFKEKEEKPTPKIKPEPRPAGDLVIE